MSKSKSKSRRKPTTKPIKKSDLSYPSFEMVQAIAEAKNFRNKLHNKYLAPIMGDRKEKFLLGAMTQQDIKNFKEQESDALQRMKKESGDFQARFNMGEKFAAVSANAVYQERFEGTVDWASIWETLQEEEQPGTLVRGSGHPCCLWYARAENQDVNHHYGPDLQPRDYALTSFYQNVLAPNKFQVKFGIDGTHDDQYTTYYYSTAGFSTFFDAVRRGRIKFKVNIDFVNAYLAGRGTSDFWDADDWGWAGAYFTIIVNRFRNNVNQRIYNSWNRDSDSVYYNTDREVALEVAHNSRITAQGWPGGADAAYFSPIPNVQRFITQTNGGNQITMEPGDRFTIGAYFLFDVQAYGDEKALGLVNIADAYGQSGHVEIKPVEVYLEECAD